MKDYTLSTIGSVTSWAFTIAQTNEILQFIMFIMSIISTAFTIAFIIYKWYNKAKEDGKITKDEVNDLIDNISDALENKEDKEK